VPDAQRSPQFSKLGKIFGKKLGKTRVDHSARRRLIADNGWPSLLSYVGEVVVGWFDATRLRVFAELQAKEGHGDKEPQRRSGPDGR
jgi:hypothetical protein